MLRHDVRGLSSALWPVLVINLLSRCDLRTKMRAPELSRQLAESRPSNDLAAHSHQIVATTKIHTRIRGECRTNSDQVFPDGMRRLLARLADGAIVEST
jgi:hypothetical protein